MIIHEHNAPANTNRIEKLEADLGTALPSDYKEFLKQYNGGYPEFDKFLFQAKYPGNHFDEDQNEAILDRFLGLYDGEYDNLETYLKVYQDRIPSNMIPIAHDPGGNLICLSIKGDDNGKVFYWRHDEEVEKGEKPNYRNIYYIADTFTLFNMSLFS